MEILPPGHALPALRVIRPERMAERTAYEARPGLRALPSGTLAVGTFAGLQVWTLTILLWAIWWPHPISTGDYLFSIGASALLGGLVIGVVLLLLRRYPGFLLAVLRAPFVRLTVTDRRILWSLPWSRRPLMEIGLERVMGGILGQVDPRGYGNAAVVLVPGDPSADIDGNIHFDRLPDVQTFVAALRG
ncbi:hypothetical protein [Sphingomonas sp.]|uniref:hypothetical protein n=1 Tax=Sphingomonas sp. TaxID=28214 RepID=UPI003B3B3F0B